jgi:hypothetical protein
LAEVGQQKISQSPEVFWFWRVSKLSRKGSALFSETLLISSHSLEQARR